MKRNYLTSLVSHVQPNGRLIYPTTEFFCGLGKSPPQARRSSIHDTLTTHIMSGQRHPQAQFCRPRSASLPRYLHRPTSTHPKARHERAHLPLPTYCRSSPRRARQSSTTAAAARPARSSSTPIAAAAPSLPPPPTQTAASPAWANPASAAAPRIARVDASVSGADMATNVPANTEAASADRVGPRARLEHRPTTLADATGLEKRRASASRLESAVKMQQVSKQMGSVVKGMDVRSVPAQNSARAAHPQRAAPTQSVLVISFPPPHAFWRRRTNPNRKLCPPQKILESMDMGKIGAVMEKFEASFDEAEVRSQYVENAMNSSTASTMPEEAVESLLQQVSEEHGLQFASRAADASTAPVAMSAPTAALEDSQEDALEKRLAALRTVG